MKRRRRWPVVVAAVALCAAFVAGWAWLFGGEAELEPVPPECQTGPTTPGIDVSYHQETIDWKRVRKSGVLFAFVRVSDGSTFADPMFDKNWNKARTTGILRGAYQYFRPDENARVQADLLIDRIEHDPGELPPVIDVETAGGRSAKQIAAGIAIWVERVRERLRIEPIIYTGPDFWKTAVGGADFTSQPLWLAHYTASCPTVPAPWQRWTFWQYSEKGAVPGIIGPTDMNVFAGTYEELEDFARSRRLSSAR